MWRNGNPHTLLVGRYWVVISYAKTQMNFLVNQLRYFKSRLTVFENNVMVTKGKGGRGRDKLQI